MPSGCQLGLDAVLLMLLLLQHNQQPCHHSHAPQLQIMTIGLLSNADDLILTSSLMCA